MDRDRKRGYIMCRLIMLQTNFQTEVAVADVKKVYIENIIKSAEKCNKIDAIVLFGSSLEDRCKEESDIDIAVISKYTVSRLCQYKSFRDFTDSMYSIDMNQNYDILYFKSLDEIVKEIEKAEICNELLQKGKVIYRIKGDKNAANFISHSQS